MKKLVLDAGHGYNTPGKRTPDGTREWSLNNAVCNYIAEYLKDYDVQITRTDDTTGRKDVSLSERVRKTNSINPNAFVSIHHNAFNGKWNDATGIEVYYHTKGTATDRKLADILDNKIAKETGLRNRGVKTASFAVLGCKSSIPAVLCEGGFMDGRNDYKIIITEKGQRAYAKGVADGIIQFLGLSKKPVTTQPSQPAQPSKPVTKEFKVRVDKKEANVRKQPNTNSALAGSKVLYKGDVFVAVGTVKGENVKGNDIWYKSKKGNYVWSGGLKRI